MTPRCSICGKAIRRNASRVVLDGGDDLRHHACDERLRAMPIADVEHLAYVADGAARLAAQAEVARREANADALTNLVRAQNGRGR